MSNPPPPGAPAGGMAVDPKEVADGKVLAILGYIFGIVAIVMLCIRTNNFVLYHAKQMLMLMIVWIVCWIPLFALILILVAVAKTVGACLAPVIYGLLFISMIALVIMGIINAANGVCKPLPVIGLYAEKWFAGIKKQGT